MRINQRYKYLCSLVLVLQFFAAQAQKLPWWAPDHTKLQYAGGIGFLSVGVGYHTNKDKLHGDVYYGYTPASLGGLPIHALTGKATWFPVKDIYYKTIQLRPFSTGVLVNYTFGKQYFGFSPENYPYDYYKFPTAFHVGAFIGGQVSKKVSSRRGLKGVGLYYELGTYDVELISYLSNHQALSVADILNLGVGIVTSF